MEPKEATTPVSLLAYAEGRSLDKNDQLATEEPLEIRVMVDRDGHLERHPITVTMRTPVPGQDYELAAGFLLTEGIVHAPESIVDISYCRSTVPESRENVVNVALRPGTPFDPERFSRNVFTNSGCGVCGKTSLEMVRTEHPHKPVGDTLWYAQDLMELPGRLTASQAAFSRTGGSHAAALFDYTQNLILLREDVGRHNAVDKVVGWLLLHERVPASDHLLLVSGRASYELVQKTIAAGIPMLAAVGAPSSLAVDLAREYGVTLVGFLSDGRFNVYSGSERIRE